MTKKSFTQQARLVGFSALISSAATYAVLALAARELGPDNYGMFASFWGGFFIFASLIGSLDLEASRQAAQSGSRSVQRNLIRVAVLQAVILSSAWVLVCIQTISAELPIVVAGLVGIWLVTGLGIIRGTLIGTGDAGSYGVIVAGEGLLRLLIVALLSPFEFHSYQKFIWITVLGFAIWIPWLGTLKLSESSVSYQEVKVNIWFLALANSGSAVLLVGLPWVISLNNSLTISQVGLFMTAVTVARIPVIGFSTIQSLLIPYFVKNHDQIQQVKFNRNLRLLLAVVISSLGLAWGMGPAAISMVFGSDFSVDGIDLMMLTLSSWLLVIHMTQASILVARSCHRYSASSWLTGATAGFTFIAYIAQSIREACIGVLLAGFVSAVTSLSFVKATRP